MDVIRYEEVCKLIASFVSFPIEGVYVDSVLYRIVRCMTVDNDAMRDKVNDYARHCIEKMKYSMEDLDVEEHLDCAMHVYDTLFYEGNQ